MTADLPQLASNVPGRDLAAAAQLVRRPTFMQDRIDAAERLYAGLMPAAAVESIDQLVAGPVEVVDLCVCPAGAICDEVRCSYCAHLDPELPCPHDTFASPAEVVERFAAVHGGRPADVVVDQVHTDAGELVAAGSSEEQVAAHVALHVEPDVDEHQVDVVDEPAPVDWPAVAAQPLAEVAAAKNLEVSLAEWQAGQDAAGGEASPSTGHLPVLDWRGRHDPRSLSFGARARGLAGPAVLADVVLPVGPQLDQGSSNGCTGYSLVDALNVLDLVAGDIDGKLLTAADADRLYLRARQLDDVPGEADTGTSVLAALQAAVEAGLIGGYLWAFGTRDIASVLMRRRPVVLGMSWLSGMFDTGPGGLLTARGDDIGLGHAIDCVGLRLKGPQGQPGPYFGLHGTWPNFGDADGIAWIHHRELAALMRGTGEAAVPTVEAQS